MTRSRTLDEIKATLCALLPELRRRYPIASVAIFGFWVRGEAGPNSDLDLLVTFDGPIGWAIVTLEDELAATLGMPVEIVLEQSLRPFIGEAVRRKKQLVWSADAEPVS